VKRIIDRLDRRGGDVDHPEADLLQIVVEDGQVVPADARIICAYDDPNGYETYVRELQAQLHDSPEERGDDEDGHEKHGSGYALLAIDQSAMTGESLAVDKYVTDVIYYTTGCKRGKAYAIVTHSAKMSFVGRTASLVSGAKDQGHFKAIMNSIGTSLLVLVVARGEAKQSRSHRIQSLGLFGGLVEGVSLEISYSKAGLLPSFRRER